MLRWLSLALIGACAYGDSIAVEVATDRHATVHEHFSLARPAEFEFLSSPCARIEEIRSSNGQPLEPIGSGPWIMVPVSAATAVDLSYQVVPMSASPRTCAVPILMPKHPVDSVSVRITDRGSGLSRVTEPRFVAHPDSKTWTATLPAVPSHVQLDWPSGDAPPASRAGPVGLFAWNFWGLVSVLVIWTIAYLFWAHRQAA